MQATRLLPLLMLISTVLAIPSSASEDALQVGDISQLDLGQMARILPPADETVAPAEPRPISLDEALRVALEKNLRVEIATADVETFDPRIDAEKAFFHPSAVADGLVGQNSNERRSGTVDRFENHDARVYLRQQVPTGGTIAVGGEWLNEDDDPGSRNEFGGPFVEVRQPLMRGGRVYVARRFISDAEFDAEIQRAKLAAEVLDVSAQTKVAYYNTVLTARLIQVIEAAIERDQELIEASRALFEAGRVTKRDVVSAQIKLSKDRIDLATREGERETAQDALRDVLGTPIGVPFEPTDRDIPFRPIEMRLPEWIKMALERRPELLEIRKQLDKAELETRVRENDLLPIVDVVGAARRDVRSGRGKNYDWQVGGLFEYPLGNVAAEKRLESARAFELRTRREYEQTERSIELEVRQIEINLRESTRRLRDLIRGVEQARAKREIAKVRFELGQADNFDITDADDDLVRAESDLLRAVVDYASNIALLEARIAAPI